MTNPKQSLESDDIFSKGRLMGMSNDSEDSEFFEMTYEQFEEGSVDFTNEELQSAIEHLQFILRQRERGIIEMGQNIVPFPES